MMCLFILISAAIIVSIGAFNDDVVTSDDEGFESIFADLIYNDYPAGDNTRESSETVFAEEEQPKLFDGVWKCGNCTNIDKFEVLFNESLDLDTNYNDENFEIQIGLSIHKMRCITVATPAYVRRVSGACAGSEVTLSIANKGSIEINIYG